MVQRRSLSDEPWRVRGFLGDEWRSAKAHHADPPPLDHWTAASIPGSVHHDLWRAREIADPYVARNSLLCEWVPQRTWVYALSFHEPPPRTGERVWLRFEGIDFQADFHLNGQHLGDHRGMFSPVAFEVGHLLRSGSPNTLAVVLAPAPAGESQVGRTDRVSTAKSRMSYGWDFCPRMIHMGIWDDVWLERSGAARIEEVTVRTDLDSDRATAVVTVTVDVAAAGDADVTVRAELSLADGLVAKADDRPSVGGGAPAALRLELSEPRLWWPNGSGEPALYDLEVALTDGTGRHIDQRRMSVGLRSVEVAPNDGAEPDARPYTLVVNGRRTYLRGWNWVPMDVLYGPHRPEKLSHLLHLAARAGVNLLRVWGGGLIERSDFYEACDRLGIMVWQEFPQSSSGFRNHPSDDPGFITHLVAEAEAAIRRRRNHPSLVLWCGGNELTDASDRPLDESNAAIGALHGCVQRLDPGRAWLPTSPSGRHEVHGPWEHQGLEAQYRLYNGGTSLLDSEFGAEGMASPATIDATIPADERWPAQRENPVYGHRGAWWANEPFVQRAFGGKLSDIGSLSRASRFLQAEALGYAVESDRRRAWRNSGSIPWQFDEPYPMAWCTSAVDYHGRPKPAYNAVARAYRAVSLSAAFDRQAWAGHERSAARVWVSNFTAHPLEGALEWRIMLPDGSAAASGRGEAVHVPADSNSWLADVDWRIPGTSGVFFLDLRLLQGADTATPSSGPLATARYLFSATADLAPMLDVPSTTLTVSADRVMDEESVLSIANRGEVVALCIDPRDARPLDAPGGLWVEDAGFHLMPGEERRLRAVWTGVPPSDRSVDVDAWNATSVSSVRA